MNSPESVGDPTGAKAIPALFTWDELMGFYVGMSVDAFGDGGWGCTADLVDVPCSLADAMLQGGQAFQCPPGPSDALTGNPCVGFTEMQIWQRAYAAESQKPQAQAPAQTCTGFGRGLGNTGALAGNQGGIPGVTVELGTAAVIPSQFGVPTGAALGPYAPNISGIIGTASFSSVSDVIGGKSPIPGVNVRTALQQLFPGQLILEIYGAGDQGANAPVSINVPAGLGCPAGTSPAVLGDPVLPSPGSPIPAVARRIRW